MTNEDAKRKADAIFSLPSEEWDFRSIPEDQLEYAIFYEYARECKWIVQRFENWHKIILTLPGADPELALWNGLTVGQALEKLQTYVAAPEVHKARLELPEAPLEVHEFLAKTGPEGDGENPQLFLLRQLNHLFPVPFLKASRIPGSRIAENISDAKKNIRVIPLNINVAPTMPWGKAPPFRVLSQAIKRNEDWDDPYRHKEGRRRFEIELDLRYSKTRLKDEIGKWISRFE